MKPISFELQINAIINNLANSAIPNYPISITSEALELSNFSNKKY